MRGTSKFPGYKRFYVKILGLKKGEKRVYFQVRGKNDLTGEIEVLPPPEDKTSSLTGRLVEVKNGQYEYEGDIINTVSVILADDQIKEVYKIDMGRNSISRSIINSLASIEDPSQAVRINLFNAKETGRARAWVAQWDPNVKDFVALSWKIPFDDLKELVEVVESVNFKGEVIDKKYDFTVYDGKIFVDLLPTINTSPENVVTDNVPAEVQAEVPYAQDTPNDAGKAFSKKADKTVTVKRPKKEKATTRRRVVKEQEEPEDEGTFEDDLPF